MAKISKQKLWKTSVEAVGNFVSRRPLYPLVFICAIFYFYHLRYMDWRFRLLFIAPVIVLNILLGYRVFHTVARRLRERKFSCWVDYVVSIILFSLLYFFGLRASWFVLFMAVIHIWLATQLFQRKFGNFYTVFSGFIIFSFVFFSYRLLHLEERLYLYSAFRLNDISVDSSQPSVRILDGGKSVQVRFPEDSALAFDLPSDLHFSAGEQRKFNYRFSFQGEPVFFVSSDSTNTFSPPFLAVYDRGTGVPLGEYDYKDEFDLLLGHRENSGEIMGVEFEGKHEISSPQSLIPLRGLFWTFQDMITGKKMRMGFYILRSVNGREFTLSLMHEYNRGLFHPLSIRNILQSLEWQSVAK